MILEKNIKSYVPMWIKSSYKDYKFKKMYDYEMIRFKKNFGSKDSKKESQIESKLIFYSHSLEKGLSHINFRYGFGVNALINLKKNLVDYVSLGYSKENLSYKNTISCLAAYKQKHVELENKTPEIFDELFSDFEKEIKESYTQIGGYSIVKKDEKKENRNKNFKELFNDRVSVREYSDEVVDLNLIKEAIDISTKTPSVCNRQSSRVRIITNSETIKETLTIQGGYSGYKLPSVLLLVTTETGSFIDYTERNQIYIDGGLFAMSLLTSIEYVGLAACALNAMFGLKTENKVRNIIGIPENENLIVFITIGNFLDETPYPKSFRYPGETITKLIE